MKLQTYLDVSQAPDVSTFERLLIEFGERLDFGISVAVLAHGWSAQGGGGTFHPVGNLPEAFTASTKGIDYPARDPVLRRLRRGQLPVVYDQDLYSAEGAGDLWEHQAPFGFRSGVAVSLHLPGNMHFMLGFDSDASMPADEARLLTTIGAVQLFAAYAQGAAVRLLGPKVASAAPPPLTARELEVLRWTMDGKSAWEVGEILSISANTVNFHLKNVLRKLDVGSKHQAVVWALSQGLL